MNLTRRLLLELVPSAIISWFFNTEKEDPNRFLAQAPKPTPKPITDEISDRNLCMYVAQEIIRSHGNFQYTPWLDCLFARFKAKRLQWVPITKTILDYLLLYTGITPNATTDNHPHIEQVFTPRYVKDIDELLAHRCTGIYGRMLYGMVASMTKHLAEQGHLPIVEVLPYVRVEAYMLETFLTVTVVQTRPDTFGPARFSQDLAPNAAT